VSTHTLRLLAAAALAGAALSAPAADLKLGHAHIGFNTRSGELTGPAGTTPPGVLASIENTQTLALVADFPLSTQWGVVVQLGTPPVLRFNGAGTGAALGAVGSARAWFPAVLARWQPAPWGAVQPYLAAGVNHTFFTDTRITPGYTAAFGGTASRSSLKASQGPVVKLGAEWRLDERWGVDVAYARYGIRTTATITTTTPGLGEVVRTVDVKADPDVFSLLLGYRF
jgi:outer membrane protein